MKQIAIFQCDLHVGGIQKALVNILNEIDYSECAVDLFLYDSECFFDLPKHENLNTYFLKPYPFLNRLVYFDVLRRLAPKPATDKEYDVAIDFNSYRNECSVGAVSVKAKKRVMWIHNDVEIKKRNEVKYRVLWHFFKGKLKYFDEFAAVSPGIIDGFRRVSGIYDRKITAIPNHIDTDEIFRKAEAPIDFSVREDEYNLCTMGRICHQKGFDILMGYMVQVREKRQDIHLYLLGDGPDREKLESQIQQLGLESAVTLLGNQQNPFPYLEKMDGFTLTSRYEGQGLVIWEAKTLGLELFITDNLVKYNPGIPGYEDLVAALCSAQRREKTRDDLHEYNAAIGQSLRKLLEIQD
jgi:glycosyltransferase involved in cell wall biosynthesis